jgi:hypothetical protein
MFLKSPSPANMQAMALHVFLISLCHQHASNGAASVAPQVVHHTLYALLLRDQLANVACA